MWWPKWCSAGWHVLALFALVGACLVVAYVHVTPFDQRTHDVGAHLRYIELVEQRHAIPSGDACWECHQPPLYYVIAARVLHAGKWPLPDEHSLHDASGARALQAVAAALGFLTLLFWLATIRIACSTTYERVVASALATFAPALLIEGCKVGNDPLVICFASGALWQLVSWRASDRARHLAFAGAFAALAIQAKANGLAIAAIVLASVLAAFLSRPDRRAPRFFWGAGACVGLMGASLGLFEYVVVHFKNGMTHPSWSGLRAQYGLNNRWQDFFTFDPSTFARNPWVHFDAGPARDEFWNYLLRSSLFGEYGTADVATTAFAYTLVGITVVLAVFALAGLVSCVRRAFGHDRHGERELVLAAFGYLGFLASLRLVAPFAVHNDFRFIVPFVVPYATMTAVALGRVRAKLGHRRPYLAMFPAWLVAVYCVASLRVTIYWT
ncbi:MAG TPA: hypothetical protein VGH28_01625 [Polyangiaceae bacterium]